MDYNQADLRLQAYTAARDFAPSTEQAIADAEKILEFVSPPEPQDDYGQLVANIDRAKDLIRTAVRETLDDDRHLNRQLTRRDGSGVTALIIGATAGLALLAIGYIVLMAVT